MAQELNSPMTIPEGLPDPSDDSAWTPDDGQEFSDEEFVARVGDGEEPGPTSEPVPPSLPNETGLEVWLPIPVEHPVDGTIERVYAKVLTGEDEEYIFKTPRFHEQVCRLVERGVERPDGKSFSYGEITAMPIGNRDALMLGVRRATYGDELDLDLTCRARGCNARNEITVDLGTEIDVEKGHNDVAIPLRRGGEAIVRWPNSDDAGAVHEASERNSRMSNAEANTLLLGRILKSVNGSPSFGERTAKSLTMPDRRDIVNYVQDHPPGPSLDGVRHECVECGAESPVGIDFEALFR